MDDVSGEEFGEDSEDPNDKSHPVEDTGFEFRKYANVESGGEIDSDGSDTEKNISPEEVDMLQIPEDKQKKKKKFPYVGRDRKDKDYNFPISYSCINDYDNC